MKFGHQLRKKALSTKSGTYLTRVLEGNISSPIHLYVCLAKGLEGSIFSQHFGHPN